jgi:ribonuclease HII
VAVVAGIDEAGLGPVLGPLVVSATAFHVPDDRADESMWDLLAGAVSRRRSRRHTKIAIGDSKKLYNRKRANALEHLERAALAAVATRKNLPTSLGKLLAIIAPGAGEKAEAYPWYAGLDVPLPDSISATDASLAGNSLSAALDAAGAKLATMRCEPLFTGEFNRLIEATNNKSVVAYDVTCRLVMHLWTKYGTAGLRVHVDRQGGRTRYLPSLQRIFHGGRFKVLDESDTRSAYRVSGTTRAMEISFSTGAEDLHLPVALASMVSKYVRELCMGMLNGFWGQYVEGLVPTAGYYVDGRRFYQEIAPAVQQLGVDPTLLYRSR